MGPGLGQFIYCFLDNRHPCSSPLTTPAHLNSHCAKLFCFDFHLPPFHVPAPPHAVLSPTPIYRPSPPPPPHPQAGHTDRHKGRQKNHTHPHAALALSLCPTRSYVTEDESQMILIGCCNLRPRETVCITVPIDANARYHLTWPYRFPPSRRRNGEKHTQSHQISEGLMSLPRYEFHQISSPSARCCAGKKKSLLSRRLLSYRFFVADQLLAR